MTITLPAPPSQTVRRAAPRYASGSGSLLGVPHGHGVLHVPAPLYPALPGAGRVSTFTVTVVFAVYVVGVLTSLVLAGQPLTWLAARRS